MFDYDLLDKIGVWKNGVLTWFTEEDFPVVYMLKIGEDNYIGSTWNIKNRINGYVTSLPNGKYQAKLVQSAYDKNDCIVIYLLERIIVGDLRRREQFYINLIHPTLNSQYNVGTNKSDFMENHVQNGLFLLRTNECLKEHNISPKRLADKLGISTFMLNKMLQRPSDDDLLKIARLLDIPFTDFFTKQSFNPNCEGSATIKVEGKTHVYTLKKLKV